MIGARDFHTIKCHVVFLLFLDVVLFAGLGLLVWSRRDTVLSSYVATAAILAFFCLISIAATICVSLLLINGTEATDGSITNATEV